MLHENIIHLFEVMIQFISWVFFTVTVELLMFLFVCLCSFLNYVDEIRISLTYLLIFHFVYMALQDFCFNRV